MGLGEELEGEESEGVELGRKGVSGSVELATDEKSCDGFLRVADILSQVLLPPSLHSPPTPSQPLPHLFYRRAFLIRILIKPLDWNSYQGFIPLYSDELKVLD